MAVNVTPPTVTGWRRMVGGETVPRLNNVTRDAIQFLLDGGEDYFAMGMERATGQLKTAVRDLETAVRVRRFLRDPTSRAIPEQSEDADAGGAQLGVARSGTRAVDLRSKKKGRARKSE